MRWRATKKEVKKPSNASAPRYNIAPFSRRLKAFVVDSFMLLMPVLYTVFYLIYGSREGFAAHMLQGWLLILIAYGVICTFFFMRSGQTPGYKAYDLVLIDLQTAQKPSLFRLITRYALLLLATFSLLGLFLPLLRHDKRAFYDLFTRTAPVCK